MKTLRYTLVSDGSSDRALQQHLTWLLRRHLPERTTIFPEWADFRPVAPRPRELSDRLRHAIDFYPCDLLFVHRDAESQPRERRLGEIRSALTRSAIESPTVCVLPVRMQEAWLLFDESALRRAAGNPHGTVSLDLPRLRDLENVPDPKALLFELLKRASELHGRRRRKFRCSQAAFALASYISDFSPLRTLSAFRSLEHDIVEALAANGWN